MTQPTQAIEPSADGATPPDAARRGAHLLAVGLVAATAHFALASRFLLYEDDYAFISPPLAWGWHEAWSYLAHCFTELPQGRPIGFAIGMLVPFLCFRVGGLLLVYACGAAFVVGNAMLAYGVLDRAFGATIALAGALAFTLFPADTTHPLLTHALILQPALTFTLLALRMDLAGRRAAAFALAGASLLTYESAVLPFFAAPLLSSRWDRGLARRWAVHVAGVAALVAAVVALRAALGEARVAGELGGHVVSRIANSLWMGPLAAAGAYPMAARYALEDAGRSGGAVVLAGGAAVAVAVGALLWTSRAAVDRRTAARAAIAGAAMLVCGYGLAFTHYPPTQVAGRGTSVHLAATLGAALLCASLVAFVLGAAARLPAARAGAVAGVALAIGVFWTFHVRVQEGFAASASAQRTYWTQLVSLMPDVAPGATVLVRGFELPVTPFILTSSWADTRIPEQLFRTAPGEHRISLVKDAEVLFAASLSARDGQLCWNANLPEWVAVDRDRPIDLQHLIVIERGRAGWRRSFAPFIVEGQAFQPPLPDMAAAARVEKGPLYDLLVAGARQATAVGALP